jgi:SAM-dependent MidA family methyltransferase
MNALAQELREEIQRRGPMPFGEFMQRALYDEAHGYYSRLDDRIGKRGDFFTSVSVGPFFGELLAFQFAHWREAFSKEDAPFQIVEAGAHDAQLAHDIIEAVRRHDPALLATLEYWIVEPSAARRAAQARRLVPFANVRWIPKFADMARSVHGVIFSNELLDALPIHRFVWSAQRRVWQELGVSVLDEQFTWTRLPQPSIAPPALPDALLDVLPDGYVVENSPAAAQWWREAASALGRGKLMTIDYGGLFEELLSPGRTSGTLRAYSQHRVSNDVLAQPGEQDMTAHVNFTELAQAGEAAGLKTETFTTQSQFLMSIARELWTRTGLWPRDQVKQFQTLTHPEHLGRPFRVLVQSR